MFNKCYNKLFKSIKLNLFIHVHALITQNKTFFNYSLQKKDQMSFFLNYFELFSLTAKTSKKNKERIHKRKQNKQAQQDN